MSGIQEGAPTDFDLCREARELANSLRKSQMNIPASIVDELATRVEYYRPRSGPPPTEQGVHDGAVQILAKRVARLERALKEIRDESLPGEYVAGLASEALSDWSTSPPSSSDTDATQ